MLSCDVCGREGFRQPAGLASHKRFKHPPEFSVAGLNTDALQRTLDALERSGRLEAVDAARVQTLRSLAQAVDDKPYDAPLWRQYREALSEVLDADGDADSDLERALNQIRSAA